LLGDYLDDYNCNQDAQLYWDELSFLIDWKRLMTATGVNVITLLGNHEAPYLTGKLHNYSLHAGIENNARSIDVADTVAEKLMTLKDYHELNYHKRKFILFHYPNLEWNGYYHQVFQLYGYVHDTRTNYFNGLWGPNAVNVGADMINYRPLSIDEVVDLVNQREMTWL